MNASALTILKGTRPAGPLNSPGTTVITFEQLKSWIFTPLFWRMLFRFGQVRLLTNQLETLPKPLLTAVLVRILSHGQCELQDDQGNCSAVDLIFISRLAGQWVRDFMKKNRLLREVQSHVVELGKDRGTELNACRFSMSPVYLRTDLSFGITSGGSVGHIAGVLNHLAEYTGPPIFLTTGQIPTVSPTVETQVFTLDNAFWNFRELPSFHLNELFFKQALRALSNRQLSFVYQRYSLNNFAGLKLAKKFALPFVLEYNGSEIWINRHWGQALRYEELSGQIELLNLQAADVIVVVSESLKAELISRGIDARKILVNPNGVDPERYSPEIDSSGLCQRLGLTGKTVIGFIGTFGRWHGAENLSAAFGELLKRNPAYRSKVRLLMIGDGIKMPDAREMAAKCGVAEECLFTGLIPQESGPQYLAAADILVAPHIPNPDGTPFFGSPTKLFEYMAMGSGIVASNLDQIGEVLQHGKTGWLVKPGDTESLWMGLKTLVDNEKLRTELGQAARKEVITRYTWQEHTHRIIEKLTERCHCD